MHCRVNFSFNWEKRQNKQKHLLIFFLRKSRLLSPIAITFIAIQRKKDKKREWCWRIEEVSWTKKDSCFKMDSLLLRSLARIYLFAFFSAGELSVAEQSTWAWRSPEFSSLELEGVIFHKLRLGSGSPIFSSGPIDLEITQAFSRSW